MINQVYECLLTSHFQFIVEKVNGTERRNLSSTHLGITVYKSVFNWFKSFS